MVVNWVVNNGKSLKDGDERVDGSERAANGGVVWWGRSRRHAGAEGATM
jgi:hypothetical protein